MKAESKILFKSNPTFWNTTLFEKYLHLVLLIPTYSLMISQIPKKFSGSDKTHFSGFGSARERLVKDPSWTVEFFF